MLSAVMEDYLKAIYHLQRETSERVRTSEIADYLGVTPPTVTSMMEKLEERELIDREKHKGVRLTRDGERVALEVIRHHRLLEAYLTEHLDYDWSEVHEEADRLEHHISEVFEERMVEALEDPTRDPHGDPIPTADLEPLAERPGSRLTEHGESETVRVMRISDRDPSVLQYLAERGITPETRITIVEVAPFGMVTVQPVDDHERISLPEEVAATVHVNPV